MRQALLIQGKDDKNILWGVKIQLGNEFEGWHWILLQCIEGVVILLHCVFLCKLYTWHRAMQWALQYTTQVLTCCVLVPPDYPAKSALCHRINWIDIKIYMLSFCCQILYPYFCETRDIRSITALSEGKAKKNSQRQRAIFDSISQVESLYEQYSILQNHYADCLINN